MNLHFSLLPAWRGAAPVQRALMAGDEITGASTFLLEEGLDTGPIYGVVTEPIGSRDTSGDLLDRLAVSGARLLVATLDGVKDGTVVAWPQPDEGVSLARKVEVDDVRVAWVAPAAQVDRLIRAATPAPGAWTTFRGRRLKVGPVLPLAEAGPPAGRLQDHGHSGVVVGTGSTAVRLGDVRPEGKAAMPAEAWARGVRLQADDRLE